MGFIVDTSDKAIDNTPRKEPGKFFRKLDTPIVGHILMMQGLHKKLLRPNYMVARADVV